VREEKVNDHLNDLLTNTPNKNPVINAISRLFTAGKIRRMRIMATELRKEFAPCIFLPMGTKELKELMTELAKECQPHGRQKEVAKELGVSEQILSNWLSGSRVPLLKNLFKIEAFLKRQKSRRKSTR
jgi:transcriptional regulator with XRE-family HTH domain